jgi:ketosteroid isomerase-like protein
MKKMLICLVAALISYPAVAQQSDAEVRNVVIAFNEAYADNRVEDYFRYYVDDAMLYFYGARQTVAGYHEEWAAMVLAGGVVEKNELSDIRVRVLPGGDAALATYFVDYQMRAPDGAVSVAKSFESDVWQKIDGEWKVVGLHYSEILPAE